MSTLPPPPPPPADLYELSQEPSGAMQVVSLKKDAHENDKEAGNHRLEARSGTTFVA